MTSLFVDRRNIQLEHDAGALVIRDQGVRVGTVPLAPITRVFLRGSITLQASVLGTLGDRGIGVVVLSGRLGQPTLFFPRPHNDARLRVEQTRRSFDADFCLACAKDLMHHKLQAQHSLCDELRERYPRERYTLTHAMRLVQNHQAQLPRAKDLDSLRGLEGAAASAYFAGLRAVVPDSLGFDERNRRPPRDPFNALLSLTYTLLHAETAITLHAAGFDPSVGYYHQLSHSRESLACDLMEPLRPLADRFCLSLVAQQSLDAEHFSTSAQGACLLGKAGRTRYYAAYEAQAPALRRAVQAQVKALGRRLAHDLPDLTPITPAWEDIFATEEADTPAA